MILPNLQAFITSVKVGLHKTEDKNYYLCAMFGSISFLQIDQQLYFSMNISL